MKLPFPFKSMETISSWPWPTCTSPKTLSFRAGNNVFKTMNSSYIDTSIELTDKPPPDSCFSDSYIESGSFSTAPAALPEESIETVIRGLSSERLFFEPGGTSSIMEEAKMADEFSFKESVLMVVDSRDPFVDFRRSMEEMVEAHGLKDWECLEELFICYLRVNDKSNHGYIVGAFIDLLVGLASVFPFFSSDHHCCSSSTTHSFTSPLSFSSSTSSTSCYLSSLEVDEEIEKTTDNASSSYNVSSSSMENM